MNSNISYISAIQDPKPRINSTAFVLSPVAHRSTVTSHLFEHCKHFHNENSQVRMCIYATCDTVDTLLTIMTCTAQVTPVMADTVTPAEPFPPRTRFLQQRILWHLSLVAMVMSSSRWCGSVRHNWTGRWHMQVCLQLIVQIKCHTWWSERNNTATKWTHSTNMMGDKG